MTPAGQERSIKIISASAGAIHQRSLVWKMPLPSLPSMASRFAFSFCGAGHDHPAPLAQ